MKVTPRLRPRGYAGDTRTSVTTITEKDFGMICFRAARATGAPGPALAGRHNGSEAARKDCDEKHRENSASSQTYILIKINIVLKHS